MSEYLGTWEHVYLSRATVEYSSNLEDRRCQLLVKHTVGQCVFLPIGLANPYSERLQARGAGGEPKMSESLYLRPFDRSPF